MAGRQNRRSQKKNVRQTRRRRRIGRKQSGLGRIIATGAKSLISSIPVVGTTLASIADFGFKAFGLTTVSKPTVGSTLSGDVRQSSLVARFEITPASILAGSKGCVQLDMGKKIISQYAEGRIININIEIIPVGDLNKRAGDWHLAFQPYFCPGSSSEAGVNSIWLPTEQGIHHMYISRTGPANKTLSLNYRPRPVDGSAFQFGDLSRGYGEIAIRYDNYCRADYGDFKASEFGCDVKISGTVETRTSAAMPPTSSGGYVFDTLVLDRLKSVGMYIMNPSRPNPWTCILNTGFSCTDQDGYCTVSGIVRQFKESCSSVTMIDDFENLMMSSE